MADTLNCEGIDLKNGSKGDNVKLLQTILKELGYYTEDGGDYLKIDGDFLTYTDKAVRAFQTANPNLLVDGIVGPVTCAKINERYLEKKGITTKTTTTTDKAASTEKVPRKTLLLQLYEKIKLYNFLKRKNANIDLNGLWLISNSVTANTPFRTGQWDRTQMMDGSWDVYRKLDSQLKYTVESTMTIKQYDQIYPALEKLQSSYIHVTGRDIRTGDYTLSVTGVAGVKHTHVKLTFELIEVDKDVK